MKNIKPFAILYIMICLEWSCSERTSNQSSFQTIPSDLYQKTEEKVFYLDSTLRFENQSMVSFEDNGNTTISIFNAMNTSVNYFDYGTGQLVEKVFFETEGPDRIGRVSNMGHFQTNKDSIFLFNHWEQKA